MPEVAVARTVLSEKGQVVIPAELRARLQLQKGDRFEVSTDGDSLVLRRLPRNPVGALFGMLKEGDSLTKELLRDHAEELRREEEREHRYQGG